MVMRDFRRPSILDEGTKGKCTENVTDMLRKETGTLKKRYMVKRAKRVGTRRRMQKRGDEEQNTMRSSKHWKK